MPLVRESRIVPLPVDAAVRLWTDLERWPTFIEGFAHVIDKDPDWPAAGTKLVWESVPGGRGRVTERMITWVPPNDGPGKLAGQVFEESLTGTQTITFEPAEGGTRDDDGAALRAPAHHLLAPGRDREGRGRAVHPAGAVGLACPHFAALRHRGGRGSCACSLDGRRRPGGQMYVFKAAVVGAGTMGGEIAQTIASAGLPVVLKDVEQRFVDQGLEKARQVTQGQLAGSSRRRRSPRRTPTASSRRWWAASPAPPSTRASATPTS